MGYNNSILRDPVGLLVENSDPKYRGCLDSISLLFIGL